MKKTISSKISGILMVTMVAMNVAIIPASAVVLPPSSVSKTPGTVVSSSTIGTFVWSNPSNATTSNNSYATTVLSNSGQNTQYLLATNFGFAIPVGSTITGVQVSIERKQACTAHNNNCNSDVVDNVVKLVKGGVVTGSNKAATTSPWTTSDVTVTYGTGSSDMWGTTWTVSDINNSNFGVVLSAIRDQGGDRTLSVDSMSITVHYTAPAPNVAPVAQAKSLVTDEDTATSSAVLATDANEDTLSYSIVANPTHGVISGFSASTGSFTYTPTANYNGSDSFTFKANDGTVDSNTATVSVTVNSVNDSPVLSALSNASADELTAITFTAVANDVDGDTPVYSLSGAPAGASIDSSTGVFSWTPTEAQGPSTNTFNLVASDGNGGSDSEPITLTVNEVNLTPLASAFSVTTQLNTAKLITLIGNDSDFPVQTLTFSISTPPSGTLGTLGVISGNQVTYTPVTNATGTDTFAYTVSDGLLVSTPATVTVTIGNDAPTLGEVSNKTVDEGSLLTFTATASDPNEDALTFTLSGEVPEGAVITEGGVFSWTPTEAQGPGTYTFSIVVSDGAASDSYAITITVTEVNSVPTARDFTGEGWFSTLEDTPVSDTLSAVDTDVPVQAPTYATATSPLHGVLTAFDTTSGAFTYTPNLNYYGVDSFTYTVGDGVNTSEVATVEINVRPVNDAPVITLIGPASLTLTVGSPWSDEGATALDAEDGDITEGITATGTVDTATPGVYTILYSVTDSGRSTPLQEETKTVMSEGLTSTTTRTVTVVPAGGSGGGNGGGGMADSRVACKDPLATNYDASAAFSNNYLCAYSSAPKGEVLGVSTSTISEAPKVAELPALPTPPAGMVLGASISCKESGLYLTKFAREGYKNDVDTVKKLQTFLNKELNMNIPITGHFGPMTTAALKKLQLIHMDTMLVPWKITQPTGILYLTTVAAINKMICSDISSTVNEKDLIPFSKNPNTPKR